MSNTQKYVDRIKEIALKSGIVLNDEEALDVLMRLSNLLLAINNDNQTRHG